MQLYTRELPYLFETGRYFVLYEVWSERRAQWEPHRAGPYPLSDVPYQAQDICGYEGVRIAGAPEPELVDVRGYAG